MHQGIFGIECLVYMTVFDSPQVTKIPCYTGVTLSAGSGNMYRHMGNDSIRLTDLCSQNEFDPLGCLFERILAVPASSAPVERVFYKSGLIVRPNRSKMSDLSRWFCQLFTRKLQVTVKLFP